MIFAPISKLKLGQPRFPDLSALREIQLGDEMAQEVDELLFVGSWRHLLPIKEPAISILTLDVLYRLSLTDLSVSTIA